MTIEAGLIASRYVHDAALTILFGVSLFQFYAFDGASAASRRMRGAGVFLALLGFASAVSWLAFTAANMQGDIAGAIDPDTLSATLMETSFGAVWSVRLLLLAVLALILFVRGKPEADAFAFLELIVAAAALASIALTGHTQMQEGDAQTMHVIADALHLLGAGAWLGGIFVLLFLLVAARTSDQNQIVAADALRRFSPIGYVAVATLIISGTINGLYLIGSLNALIETPYGRLLLVKLALVGLMLLLAASNRFVLVPRLADDATRGGALSRFTRQVALEQIAGLGVLAIVAILGMTEPPTGM